MCNQHERLRRAVTASNGWVRRTRRIHRPITRRLAVVLLAATLVSPLWPVASTAQAADVLETPPTQDCQVGGPVDRFGPRLEDFDSGRTAGGSPYIKRVDLGYWSGRGYMVGFDREDGSSYESSRRGGFVFSGIVLAPDQATAGADLRDAVAGWTSNWEDAQPQPLAGVGDEAFVVQRNTSWEVAPGQPMTEVLLGFRHCNVSAVILLAAMPEFDPVRQATRYAHIIMGKVA
jgi:hypothetical protein